MRSSDFTTCADGPTLPTRNRQSAPAAFSRVSCGTTSTSFPSNFSMPAGLRPLASSAASSPFSFDSPHGLLTRIIPQFLALNVFCAYWSIALSTISSTAETRNTKFGLAPFCVIGVPAAHGPMNGTFASFMIGTIASDTGVSSPPNSTATFSLNTSSRAAITPFAGVASSSRRMSSNLRPLSTPPLAFSSSIAIVRPRVIASPARADWPDSAVTRPILIGSCAAAGSAAPPTAAARASFRNVRRWNMTPSLSKKRAPLRKRHAIRSALAGGAIRQRTCEEVGLCPSTTGPGRARHRGARRTGTAHGYRGVTAP